MITLTNNMQRQAQALKRMTILGVLGCYLGMPWMASASQLAPNETLQHQIEQKVIDHVKHAITPYFKNSSPNTEIQVEIVNIPPSASLLSEDQTQLPIQIGTDSNLTKTLSSWAVIRTKLSNEKGIIRQIGIPVRIAIFKSVWVVKKPINAHSSLRATDLMIEKKEVSKNLDTIIDSTQSLNDLEARINLKPGDVLDIRKVETPMAIKPNSDVYILLSNQEGMNITLHGTALTGGKIGDTIRVKYNLHKTRYYSGKIIGRNKVHVEM